MKKKVLLSAANPQSFKNISIICDSLDPSKFEFYFADFRDVYKQDFQLPPYISKVLNFDGLKDSFYLKNSIGKIQLLIKLRRHFRRLEEDVHLCLLGDFGILEYWLVRSVNPSKTLFIQDAILLWPEKQSFFKRLRGFLYGFRPRYRLIDNIYCSGEATKKTLTLDGANAEIIKTVGIPRFKDGMKLRKRSYDGGTIEILIIGASYTWHGRDDLQKKQAQFLNKIDQNPKENVRYNFRIHPRDFDNYEFKNIKIQHSKEMTLKDSIEENHLVVSYQFPSTIIFELMNLDVPCIFVESNKIDYSFMTSWEEFKKVFNTIDEDNFLEIDLVPLIRNHFYAAEASKGFFSTDFLLDEILEAFK
ncbi:hypothetical protein [Ekhidna sp.]